MKPVFKKSFPPIQEADILWCEQALNITFPEEYRKFLLEINGGTPKPNAFSTEMHAFSGIFFCGLSLDCNMRPNSNILEKYSDGQYHLKTIGCLPDNLLEIASDIFGNCVLLSISGPDKGVVYWWAHDMGEYDNEDGDFVYTKMADDPVAPNFDVFLNSAVDPKEYWGDDYIEDEDDEEDDYDDTADD